MKNLPKLEEILFTKCRQVKSPERGTKESAGIDFFVPKQQSSIEVLPHTTHKIPSGIKAVIPKGTALIAFNKSGVASKKGLDVMACVIDSDYRGEIHLSVCNTSNVKQFIMPNEKLIQMILLPYIPATIKEIENEEYEEKYSDTERGEGGFGSTNK